MKQTIKTVVSGLGIAILLVLLMATSVGTSVAQERAVRGYMTTPPELRAIATKAQAGKEPYKSAVKEVLEWANRSWSFTISNSVSCSDADNPAWIDDRGTGIVYANALAYHLTGDVKYAERVVTHIKKVMKDVIVLPLDKQCRLNFAWGIPEWVASADLIDGYWRDMTCTGPTTSVYNNGTLGQGNCKRLFQNWLAKNPYYLISLSAVSQSNWGAAAANATAYIADYLWDRPEIVLIHRHPREMLNGANLPMNPAQAYAYAKQLLLNRLNGTAVEHNGSTSCDILSGSQQQSGRPPVKSQFSERGIIPDDARREGYCNIDRYNGEYQNYPQIHISNTLQQCELMLRRGDRSCYDNINMTDIPQYNFIGPDGKSKTTHLYPGRGSIERAINAIIVDSGTEWKHDAALYVAYRYYAANSRFGQVGQWARHMDRSGGCSQGVCFGKLTHAFAPGETPTLPQRIVSAPIDMATSAALPLPLPPPTN